MPGTPRFETCLTTPVDISVIVVTFDSRADLPLLIGDLRREAADLRLRVIVVDNDSSDGSHAVAAGEGDVIAVASGGNLGYAAAINIGSRYVGRCRARLILNPDLRVGPGALPVLFARLHSRRDIGVVAPRILDEDGRTYPSVRYEPSIGRAFGDAVFGSYWPSRPARLRETEYGASFYETAQPIEWATGAALLISSAAADRAGPWDEGFFLYSEETDFMRRVRSAGLSVWFEPRAVVRHRQGGSGSSPELSALRAVSRVRYFAKNHGRVGAAAFRWTCLVGLLLRFRQADARRAAYYLSSTSRWYRLPGPQVPRDPKVVNTAS